jgi:hypothetical protein
MIAKETPEMPNRDTEPCAQGRFGSYVEHAGDDELDGPADQFWSSLHAKAPGRDMACTEDTRDTLRLRQRRAARRFVPSQRAALRHILAGSRCRSFGRQRTWSQLLYTSLATPPLARFGQHGLGLNPGPNDFKRRCEPAAEPVEWKVMRSDLANLMERLADKPDFQAPPATPTDT